jgi:hypothetical protein
MYIGASLALITDLALPSLVVPSVALFMFFITIIGGNMPFLVPLIISLSENIQYKFTFSAAQLAGTDTVILPSVLSASTTSGVVLRDAMLLSICSLYLVSSILYLACVPLLNRTKPYGDRAKWSLLSNSSNRNSQ